MAKAFGSVVLSLIVVAAFASLVAMALISSRIADENYLSDAIAKNDVIERLYNDLLTDPAFGRELDQLLAGSKVSGKEVIATIKKIAPPEFLAKQTEALISHLVGHLRGRSALTLTIDITDVVSSVRRVALDTATRMTAELPPDPDDPGAAERQLDEAKQLIELSVQRLTHNPYVTEVDEGGTPHYILGPGEQITAIVERKLAPFRALDRATERGRFVAAGALVFAVIALAVLHRRDRRSQLAWIGAALTVAGLVALIGWAIGRGVAQADITALLERKGLPPAIKSSIGDVVASSIRDLTPGIWGASAAIAGLGVIALLASRACGHVIRTAPSPDGR